MANIIERAKTQRKIIEQAAQSLDDKTALTCPELFPAFETLVREQYVATAKGFRFAYAGKLYETAQEKTEFVAHYPPGEGTESLYVLVDVEHSGTADDPIPYSGNMVLENGKYYSQGGGIYRCFRDTINPVYNALADLVGIYVEKETTA